MYATKNMNSQWTKVSKAWYVAYMFKRRFQLQRSVTDGTKVKKIEPKRRIRNARSLPSTRNQSSSKSRRKTESNESRKNGPFIDVHNWPSLDQPENEVFERRRSSFSKIAMVARRLSRKSRKPKTTVQNDHEKLWISLDEFIQKCLIFD